MDLYLKMKEIGGDGCLGERDLIKQPYNDWGQSYKYNRGSHKPGRSWLSPNHIHYYCCPLAKHYNNYWHVKTILNSRRNYVRVQNGILHQKRVQTDFDKGEERLWLASFSHMFCSSLDPPSPVKWFIRKTFISVFFGRWLPQVVALWGLGFFFFFLGS